MKKILYIFLLIVFAPLQGFTWQLIGSGSVDGSSTAVAVDHLWEMENNLTDSVGSANLSGSGITYTTITPIRGAYSAVFSGGTSYVEGDLGGCTVFTTGAWIKPTSVASYQMIAADHSAISGEYGWAFKITDSGGIEVGISQNGTTWNSWISASGLIPANSNTHVAVKYDGTSVKLFINGSPVTSGDFPATYSGGVYNSPNLFSIGAYYQAGWQQTFAGIMDEVFFTATALPDSDISTIYTNGL